MSPQYNVADMLSRKQILDQMNQTTSQGAGAAMLGGGANLRQFDDTGGGTQTTSTGVSPPSDTSPTKGGGGFIGRTLGLNLPAEAISKGVQGLGLGKEISKLTHPTAPFNPNEPAPTASQIPTLVNRTPANQPTLQPGQMLQMDADGNITAVAHDPNRVQAPSLGTGRPLYTPAQLVGQY